MKADFKGLLVLVMVCWLTLLLLLVSLIIDEDNSAKEQTVNIGNQTLTLEDAFEYVTKGLSDHQWLELQEAINQSCEVSDDMP